jgi:phospholipid/cholesterol/gamma-HCH transport system substrate-binding protein
MTAKRNFTLVGAFVLVLGAVFIWGTLWIASGGRPKEFDYYVSYMQESVSGLNTDAAVKFRGVDVGMVKQISIDADDPERIRLLLQVRQGTPIREGTVAVLEFQGLTGLANINLIGGRAESPRLEVPPGEDYPVIPSHPSLFARLDESTSQLLANLIQTSANLNVLLGGESGAHIAESIENLSILTHNLAEQSNRMGELVGRIDHILANTESASEEFPDLVARFGRSADSITSMAGEVRGVAENLAEASAGIADTVEVSGADLQQFTGTTLTELSAVIAELRVASENLRRASEALARDPSVLIYGAGEAKRGPGE